MKINRTLLFLILWPPVLLAQRQTIASQGGTYETASKVLVSQSVGQASVIGGFGSRNAQVIQGYQQPNWDNLILQSPVPLSITIKFCYCTLLCFLGSPDSSPKGLKKAKKSSKIRVCIIFFIEYGRLPTSLLN